MTEESVFSDHKLGDSGDCDKHLTHLLKVPVPSFDLLPRVGAAFSQSAGEDVWLKVCLVVVVGVGVGVDVGVDNILTGKCWWLMCRPLKGPTSDSGEMLLALNWN